MTLKSHNRVGVFPGSFNPFTIGHLSVVQRAMTLFDRIVIGIGFNPEKGGSEASALARAERIRKVFADNQCVEVTVYSGLTIDLCKTVGAMHIIRGVRTVADFEYERNLADVNRRIGGVETVLLYTLPEHAAISSSMVRELESFGADITPFIP